MDDQRPTFRTSGIPRPSRIPASFSASSASSSSASIPARPLAVRPSRENLHTPSGSIGGELRNPKLRSVPSRDRLSLQPPGSSPAAARHPSPRTRAVSGQYAKAGARPSSSSSGSASPLPSRGRQSDSFLLASSASAPAMASRRPGAPSLARRPSRQQLAYSPTTTDSASHSPTDDGAPGSPASASTATSASSMRLRPVRSRPSLSERAAETLAMIPSSPAMRGRTSSFYEGEPTPRLPSVGSRPGSRGGSGGSSSRPGSGYRPNQPLSRPQSRPGSSSGRDDASSSNFRGSTTTAAAFKSAVPPSFVSIDEMPTPDRVPAVRPSRPSLGSGPSSASHRGLQRSAPGLNSQLQATWETANSRAASPEKPSATGRPTSGRAMGPAATSGKYASKTVAARPLQSRPSLNRLLRKPSVPNLDSSASALTSPVATRKSSLTSRASSTSYEDSNPSSASTASTSLSVDSAESGSPVLGSRKSSAALREQIAKARAAKRVASLQQQSGSNDSGKLSLSSDTADPSVAIGIPVSVFDDVDEAPVVPTDTTFDFGLSTDPFGQKRGDQSQVKVIEARVKSARTSGRLNIAAMGLREIPSSVMNIYDSETTGAYDGSWAESVDLTRFVAADNEIEMIEDTVFPDLTPEELAASEDGRGNIFGGLETLDLHGNMLICLPMGLRRLQMLTSLNLSQNRITNNALEVISQITSLRDLKLGGNLFYGPLDPLFVKLENLEIADLHGNNISALPINIDNMAKLRILNISENNFENLLFEPLSKLPLTELIARKNKLSGTLIEDEVSCLRTLQVLDVSSNQITHLVSASRPDHLELPALHQLCVSMNRLQLLPDITTWTHLVTLNADENGISSVPEGFTQLKHLRHADFSSNDIRVVPAEIGRMESLAMIRLSGNPLRDRKFISASTDELKAALASRLEPEPEPEPVPGLELGSELDDELRDAVTELTTRTGASMTTSTHHRRQRSAGMPGSDDNNSDDDFATPPTSVPHTPARSRSQTVSNQIWAVKTGGVLDRSGTESSSLHPVISSRVAREHTVREIFLQRNLFSAMPDSLSFFAETLTVLSLAHNQLRGESYLGDAATSDGLDLPALKELNLSSNHITGLSPLVQHLRAPALQKLDVSQNRVSTLPYGSTPTLRAAFPVLTILLASNNHLAELEPESIKGLRIVDVSNNDIEHLNPRLGLLGGLGGLERLEVLGNRFRVPRFNVIERGTEATLRWLRGRVPVAEMGVWREANQRNDGDVDNDVD